MTAENGSTEKPTAEGAAEALGGDEQKAQGQTQAPVAILAQYIKDLSFEVPGAPQVYVELQNAKPDITVNIDVRAEPFQETVFEVTLHISASCKVADKTAFICELVYAGLCTVNVPEEHRQAMLLIECPRLLFPFARNIVADATRDGGFPPLMLAPVDFVSMFQNMVAQQQAQAQAGGNGTEKA